MPVSLAAAAIAAAPSRGRRPVSTRRTALTLGRASGPYTTRVMHVVRYGGVVVLAAGVLAAAGPLACARAGRPAVGTGAPADRSHTSRALDAAVWGSRPVSRVEELLAGYVAGVAVTSTPGGYTVRVRGAASLTGDAEPLYVVDGLPLVPQGTRTLDGLNPADVLRVEVLKDPVDLSFYGVRGAHGVIRITTKRASAR